MSRTSPFAIKSVLAGRKVTLRPFRDDDLLAIATALADPEVLRLTGSVHSSAEASGRQPHVDERTRRWCGPPQTPPSPNSLPPRVSLTTHPHRGIVRVNFVHLRPGGPHFSCA